MMHINALGLENVADLDVVAAIKAWHAASKRGRYFKGKLYFWGIEEHLGASVGTDTRSVGGLRWTISNYIHLIAPKLNSR